MKNKFSRWSTMLLLLAGIFSLVSMTSCKDDKDEDDPKNPVASFQYAIDQDDFLKVTFSTDALIFQALNKSYCSLTF